MMVSGYHRKNYYAAEKKEKFQIIGTFFLFFIIAVVIVGTIFFLKDEKSDKKNDEISSASDMAINKNDNGDSRNCNEPSVTFENLLVNEPDAPVKVMGTGNFYARAKSAIAIDANTHTILHYQDGKKRAAIASLTKIMTAILTVESIPNLDNEYVTINDDAVSTDGTIVGCPRSGYCISNRLKIGEKLAAKDLLEAMLMNSANDAAVALGDHIAGSQKGFAEKMNEKARELGLVDTNFCNPSGLDEDDNPGGCYSTAYDFARIAAYSLQYDQIWQIMNVKEKDICSKDGIITHHIVNTDIMLGQIPNCLGGKTGFTYEAGKSLMMAAYNPSNRSNRIVAVILDDFYRWEDMKDLINWLFQSYNWPDRNNL